MTLTPYCDAARESVDKVRALYAEREGRDPLQCIHDRMVIEMNAAALIGAAELLDLDASAGRVGTAVTGAMGTALASVALTLAGANEAVALQLVEHQLGRVREVAHASVRAAPVNGVVGTSVKQPMAGRA